MSYYLITRGFFFVFFWGGGVIMLIIHRTIITVSVLHIHTVEYGLSITDLILFYSRHMYKTLPTPPPHVHMHAVSVIVSTGDCDKWTSVKQRVQVIACQVDNVFWLYDMNVLLAHCTVVNGYLYVHYMYYVVFLG